MKSKIELEVEFYLVVHREDEEEWDYERDWYDLCRGIGAWRAVAMLIDKRHEVAGRARYRRAKKG